MGSIPVGESDISLSHARVMLNNSCFTLLSNFRSVICPVVACRLKTEENFQLLALEVVAVAYERWSVTRLRFQV